MGPHIDLTGLESPELQFITKEFMTNNEQLPEDMMDDLRRNLDKPRQQLANIEAEIANLLEHIKELTTKWQNIQKHISQYDSLLAPIRRLPPDILHEIFQHCLPTSHNPIMSSNMAPILLTHICRAWRLIAHASPSLWARIYITFSHEGSPEQIRQRRMSPTILTQQYISSSLRLRCVAVEEWLSRSGMCPLSISLCHTPSVGFPYIRPSPGNSDHTVALFRILARSARRWRRLELRMPTEVYRLLEEMVPVSQLLMLDSTRISLFTQRGVNGPINEPPIRFVQAPNIERMSLSTYTPEITNLLSHPNIRNITNLSLDWELFYTIALSLLQNCSNLEYAKISLTLDFPGLDVLLPSPRPALEVAFLPHLRGLSIDDGSHPDSGRKFFGCLDAPHLEWLDYTRTTDCTTAEDQTALVTFLEKLTNLKKLTITANGVSTSELRINLKSAQSISHLVFGPETRRSDNSLAPELAHKPLRDPYPVWNFRNLFLRNDEEGQANTHSILHPHLEILEISQIASAYLTGEMLLDVILHREGLAISKDVVPLKKVAVVFYGDKEIDIPQELCNRSEYATKIELNLQYPNYDDLGRPPFLKPRYGTDDARGIEELMIFS